MVVFCSIFKVSPKASIGNAKAFKTIYTNCSTPLLRPIRSTPETLLPRSPCLFPCSLSLIYLKNSAIYNIQKKNRPNNSSSDHSTTICTAGENWWYGSLTNNEGESYTDDGEGETSFVG